MRKRRSERRENRFGKIRCDDDDDDVQSCAAQITDGLERARKERNRARRMEGGREEPKLCTEKIHLAKEVIS